MSFVVAVMRPGYSVVAGDTQLNDENGRRPETGIKVFPLDDYTVVGLVGDYTGHLNTIQSFIAHSDKRLAFEEKTSLFSKLLSEKCKDYNGIMVCVIDGKTLYSVFSSQEDWKSVPTTAHEGEVKVLVPPDVKEEFCYPYITSLIDIKAQAIRCVKAVGSRSTSVNDKVFGAELTGKGTIFFTDGIQYNDITMRLL